MWAARPPSPRAPPTPPRCWRTPSAGAAGTSPSTWRGRTAALYIPQDMTVTLNPNLNKIPAVVRRNVFVQSYCAKAFKAFFHLYRNESLRENIKAAKTLVIILIVFFVCWFPFFLTYFLSFVGKVKFESSLLVFSILKYICPKQ